MVNTNHDAGGYDRACSQREVTDANLLYESFMKTKQGSDWKPKVQQFEMTYLLGIGEIQEELRSGEYKFLPNSKFVIRERGKVRVITGENIRDRIPKRALCDGVLIPAARRHLIYDNGASLKDKGVDFTRRRLIAHLERFYRENGSNDGWILLGDYSKFYDNIRHKELIEMFRKCVNDPIALDYTACVVDRSKVDVSYMSDEEYERCMDEVYNSLEYESAGHPQRGERYMRKHLNIGDPVAQIAGVYYPTPVDNYVKIVRGCKYYARYMDDFYVIHRDRGFLKELLGEIIEKAKGLGITINERKTRICKLSSLWRFLQIQYSLTESGRIIRKIHPKRLTVMRRKMKKLAPKMSPDDFENWYQSWYQNYRNIMSGRQRKSMTDLYIFLKEVNYGCANVGRRNTD